jgi:hypothetical protein
MSRSGYFLCTVLLAVATSITFACGSGSKPTRVIQSLSVSPGSADAKDYPNGEVPFVATGIYNAAPMMVTPLQSTWAVVNQNGDQTTDVLINANGVAHCAAGASGAYNVGGWVAITPSPGGLCNVSSAYGNPCGDSVLGVAQLTCP